MDFESYYFERSNLREIGKWKYIYLDFEREGRRCGLVPNGFVVSSEERDPS